MKMRLGFLLRTLFLTVFFVSIAVSAYRYKLSPSQQQALKRDLMIAWQEKKWPISVERGQLVGLIDVKALFTPPLESEDEALETYQQSFERHRIACFKTKTKVVTQAAQSSIYAWVDEHGKKYFSDIRPQHEIKLETISSQYKSRLNYFDLTINEDQAKNMGFIRDTISADVRQIYRILTSDLEIKHLRQVKLNLRLFQDQSDFQQYKNKLAPALNTNSGFYISRLNEAIVYQWPDNDDLTQSVIRHESLHVIMAGLFGETPRWFNEGLAEYFERLQLAGQKKQVKVAQKSIERLTRLYHDGRLPTLASVFDLTAGQFYQKKSVDQNYALSWAAVFFLLSKDEGRSLFNAVTDQLSAEPCSYVNMRELAKQHYQGGMSALEQDFLYWLTSRDIYDHYY